jgi:hypothetical protein
MTILTSHTLEIQNYLLFVDLLSFYLSPKSSPNLLGLPKDSILELLAAPVSLAEVLEVSILGVPGRPPLRGAVATKIAYF